jgi:hypothetical protein
VFAPPALAPALLEAVLKHYGILHLLFHPAHIDRPGVADAIREAVRAGEARGLAWWTGREIAAWEAARREALWGRSPSGDAVTLTAAAALPGATVLLLDTGGHSLRVEEKEAEEEQVERWSFRFRSATFDLAAGESVTLRRKPDGT